MQRSGLYLRETFLPMGILPVIFPGAENGLVFGSKTAPYLCYEPGLRLEIPAADKLPGKGEYVASLSGTEVMPYIFTDIQLERGGALLPIRGQIPIFLSPFFWHGWDMNRQEDGGMNIGIWPRTGRSAQIGRASCRERVFRAV